MTRHTRPCGQTIIPRTCCLSKQFHRGASTHATSHSKTWTRTSFRKKNKCGGQSLLSTGWTLICSKQQKMERRKKKNTHEILAEKIVKASGIPSSYATSCWWRAQKPPQEAARSGMTSVWTGAGKQSERHRTIEEIITCDQSSGHDLAISFQWFRQYSAFKNTLSRCKNFLFYKILKYIKHYLEEQITNMSK